MLYACSFSGVKTPDEYELAGCLGVYFPVVEEEKQIVLNERRVYERGIGLERHEDYGYLEVWWADGYWWMGTSTVRGKPEGILRRKSCSPIPETVHMAWEVCVSLGQALGKAWRKTDIVCSSVPPVAGSVDGDDGGGSGGGGGGDGDLRYCQSQFHWERSSLTISWQHFVHWRKPSAPKSPQSHLGQG